MSELPFIERLQNGEEEAFKKLINENKTAVYNTVIGFLRSEVESEDIAQEVFIEAFNSIKKFRGDSKLSTWLYRIAVTKSLEYIRKTKRKKRFAFLSSLWNNNNELIYEPEEHIHPGIVLERKAHARALFDALEKLPESQRTVFVLHKVENIAYQEIAEILKISLSSVESLMFRAKKNLKIVLRHYYENEM